MPYLNPARFVTLGHLRITVHLRRRAALLDVTAPLAGLAQPNRKSLRPLLAFMHSTQL